MSQVVALARMRFGGYARSQRVLAPVIATLCILGVLHNGSPSTATEAYGFSAIILFGVLGWQAKLAFDTEPDSQRQLSFLAVGSARRDVAAGLLSAAATAIPTILVALVAPWLVGAIAVGDSSVGAAILLGLWLHVTAAVPAIAIGAIASRPITRTRGWGVTALVGGAVIVLVLGVANAPGIRWLVPQLLGLMRSAQRGDVVLALLLTVHAFVWSGLLFLGYFGLRNRRR
jgi:hypothetical protein